MKTITIQIKNMVCPRCVHVVKQILSEMEISFTEVNLGYATLRTNEFPDLQLLHQRLEQLDLGLILDQNELLVASINRAIYQYMDNISFFGRQFTLSDFIAKELARNYHQLSKMYRNVTGNTIECHFIEMRTNRVKELIKQGNLNLSQIAITVGCSSIHYLSGQFKKYTGMSLSEYRKKWEEEVRISYKNVKSEIVRKKDCEFEVSHRNDDQHVINVQLTSSRPESRKSSKSQLNSIPQEFREFRAFINHTTST